MPIVVDKNVCLGCGACTSVCPTGAIELNSDGQAECNQDVCIECQACVGTCPVSAIKSE